MELLARLPWNQGMDKCALTKHYMDTSHHLNLRWTEFEGERGILPNAREGWLERLQWRLHDRVRGRWPLRSCGKRLARGLRLRSCQGPLEQWGGWTSS